MALVPDDALREVAGLLPSSTISYETFTSYGGVWEKTADGVKWTTPQITVTDGDVATELLACREALMEYKDDQRAVVREECAPDEKHCTCVPHLRRAMAANVTARRTADALLRELLNTFTPGHIDDITYSDLGTRIARSLLPEHQEPEDD